MKPTLSKVMVAFIVTALAGPAFARDPIIYPAKGQNQQQQERDRFECYSWAVRQTGFDPMKQPTATTPPPSQQTSGGAVRGAARGAAAGAIGGAIGGDAGKGAAIGAGAGGFIGGMRRRQSQREQQARNQQWAQQQSQQYQARRAQYDRAFGACMEGRGYVVN